MYQKKNCTLFAKLHCSPCRSTQTDCTNVHSWPSRPRFLKNSMLITCWKKRRMNWNNYGASLQEAWPTLSWQRQFKHAVVPIRNNSCLAWIETTSGSTNMTTSSTMILGSSLAPTATILTSWPQLWHCWQISFAAGRRAASCWLSASTHCCGMHELTGKWKEVKLLHLLILATQPKGPMLYACQCVSCLQSHWLYRLSKKWTLFSHFATLKIRLLGFFNTLFLS
jgi:hypothetical protein